MTTWNTWVTDEQAVSLITAYDTGMHEGLKHLRSKLAATNPFSDEEHALRQAWFLGYNRAFELCKYL